MAPGPIHVPGRPPADGLRVGRWVGVDGCRGGWIYIALRRDGFAYGVVDSLEVLLAELPDDAQLLVDMPIGLLDGGGQGRACDLAARRLLGPRRSSVFAAPLRPVLAAVDYADAKRRSVAASGKALSRQAYGILPRIRELDRLLRARPGLQGRVRECHPELCFWALAGGRPMPHAKRRPQGFAERLAVLEAVSPGAGAMVAEAYLWTSQQGAARDDVVDAMVNAVTARLGAGAYRTLPAQPPRDAAGLAMEMVYAVP
jgi:predicted RNase H-like nuclease